MSRGKVAGNSKSEQVTLGELEQLVLLALVRLRDNAYGVTIRAEIERRAGREDSIAAVYTTLDRLAGGLPAARALRRARRSHHRSAL
jgi:hypothetical protein